MHIYTVYMYIQCLCACYERLYHSMKHSKHIYYNLNQQMFTMFGLNDSNGIVMQRKEYIWNFLRTLKESTHWQILVSSYSSSRCAVLHYQFQSEPNTNSLCWILKNGYAFELYTISVNIFTAKAHTGNCRPVHGPLVDKQQQVVYLTA
jgi:hypothetical protein